MVTRLQSLMAKRRGNSGFTMMEMMLTLAIVSIILSITITSIPEYRVDNVDDEIENISYIFQGAQMSAIADGQSYVVLMNYINNEISVRNISGKTINTHKLNVCSLEDYGLKQITYRRTGDTSAFGTVYLSCDGKSVKFIMQIQKGRIRIEQ